MNPNVIVKLPCGCIMADSHFLIFHRVHKIAECHWCGATFSYADLDVYETEDLTFHFGRRRLLMDIGGIMLDVVKPCECGDLVVRERGKLADFHLGDEMQAATFLYD